MLTDYVPNRIMILNSTEGGTNIQNTIKKKINTNPTINPDNIYRHE